jgi:gliding motility-associated lipoprotein GldH
MRLFKTFCLFLVASAVLFSCGDPNRVFELNQEIDGGWKRSESIDFEFEIENTKQAYNLIYNVRNSLDYKYRNLYLKYVLEDSVGNKLTGGLQQVYLFHPKTGVPTGKESGQTGKSLGDIYDHQFPCMKKVTFQEAGKYRFRVFHYMRGKDVLENILAIGLRVENYQSPEAE